MRDHFFDSSDYSPRAVETVLGSYIMAVFLWNVVQILSPLATEATKLSLVATKYMPSVP
jgi:hypothetical protein